MDRASRKERRRARSAQRGDQRPSRDAWATAWFTREDKQSWQSVGIYQPSDALKCIEKGLRPADMSLRINGRLVGEMITGGVPIAVVLHLIVQERERERGSA